MRYAYAITTALLVGGAAATMTMQQPVGAQVAQNESGAIAAAAPRAGAPMSFADLAATLQPAVVNISTTQRVEVANTNPFAGTPFGGLFGNPGGGDNSGRPVTREATSLGSGFIISPDGYIVTNNHVISGGRAGAVVKAITVTMPDRKEYVAKLIGRDVASDLAVLKIEATNLPFVKFGDSTRARVGDWVVAIGNPFGLGGSVTAGIVSAVHRGGVNGGGAYDRYIQTDASINQGNSGGPMFDLNGNVIGINTAILSPSGGNVGIGFAIPAELARPIVDTLRRGDTVKRGYLGVQIQPFTEDIADSMGLPKNRGELIAAVEPNQGAARAGIRQGDVVVTVAGKPVTPDENLSFIVSNLAIGSKVPIELVRDGKRMTVTATIGERPSEEQLAASLGAGDDSFSQEDTESTEQAARESLGIAAIPLTPAIARSVNVPAGTTGLVITGVDPSSDAAQKTLRRGDVIVSINRRPAAKMQDLTAAVTEAKTAGRNSVLLLIQRGTGPSRYIGIRLGDS